MTENKYETDSYEMVPYNPEYLADNTPIVGVDAEKEGCPVPPIIDRTLGLVDPRFEAVVPAAT